VLKRGRKRLEKEWGKSWRWPKGVSVCTGS
jgi:hypothetical protein